MNLKKHIRLKNSNNRERQLTEDEQALYNSLIAQVESNSASGAAVKKKQNLWRILTPILSVAGAIAITLTCVFTLKGSGDYVYNDNNIIHKETTFDAMQSDLKYFSFDYPALDNYQVYVAYDAISNDTLFYTYSIEYSNINFVIVINEKYEYKFNMDGEVVTKQLLDYSITYSGISSRGQPDTTYKGWIKVQTETVYFDYVQTPDAGEDAFFESIQQIVKVKK